MAEHAPHSPPLAPGPVYRPLVPVALALAGGILLRQWAGLPRALVLGLAAAAALGFPLARRSGHLRLALAGLYLLILGAGWLRLDLAATPPPDHHLAHVLTTEPRLLKLRGVVDSDPVTTVSPPMPLSGESDWLARPERKCRLEFRLEAVWLKGGWAATGGRAQLTVYKPRGRLRYGDHLVLTASASTPRGPGNPGEFDWARHLRHRDIRIRLVTEANAITVVERGGGGPLGSLAASARRAHRRLIDRTFGRRDSQAGDMLRATILGDRAELDAGLETAFQRSGTMHLLAISGLHVGIVAFIMWKMASLLGLGRPASGGLVLLAVGLYALTVGLTPSVTRATVITAVVVLAIIGRRRVDPLHATAVAAIVLLLAQPYSLFNAGFQLSFAAVVSISCLYGEFREAFRRPETLETRLLEEQDIGLPRRTARWMGRLTVGALIVSLTAWLGVFPLIAHYFHVFSPVTVLANLLAVPLLSAVVPLGFVHWAAGAVWSGLAGVPGWLAEGATACLAGVVRGAAQLPLAWTYCPGPSWGWLAAYYGLGAVLLARRRLGIKGRTAAALGLVGLSIYLFATAAPAQPDGLELTVLDVRHGSAAALRYPDGTTVLADCGTYGRADVGRYAVAPALWQQGVRQIDLLALSHGDVDHINGVPALLDRFRIGRVVYSPALPRCEAGKQLMAMLDARGIPHEAVRAGDQLRLGNGHTIEVLAPSEWLRRALPDDQNENSLVLRAEHAGRRVLLTGDAQEAATTVLLRSGTNVRADVLVVPHHGCRMDNTPAFAEAVRPAVAICSNQRDRLPPETIAHYQAAGARVLTTCRHGAVTVRLNETGLHVHPFRETASEPASAAE